MLRAVQGMRLVQLIVDLAQVLATLFQATVPQQVPAARAGAFALCVAIAFNTHFVFPLF